MPVGSRSARRGLILHRRARPHSVKLDAPSLSALIGANLFADDKGEGLALIWSRPCKSTD